MNHVIAENEIATNKITDNVSTLDEEVKTIPFLIKIDVEGYETPALEGAKNILSNEGLCAVIMELNGAGNRYGYDETKILTMMSELGFKTYSYSPFERKLTSLEGKNPSQGNTIFIRNLERVSERIKSAPKIKVQGVSI